MKKTVLWSVLILLLALLVIPASAAETAHPHAGDHCVCGGSAKGVHDHACDAIQWTPLPKGTKDFSKLADGNYYLTANVTVTAATNWDDSQKITLCLNGYDIQTSSSAVFGYIKAGSVLNICDCSGTQDAQGNWSWGGSIYANQAGKSRSYGGIFNLNADALANIYGGNFIGPDSAVCGGTINVCNDSYAFAGYTANTDPAIFTKLTVYNGYIQGGSVSKQGGAINTWHTADVSIYGGTITGGSASTGGNIYFSSGDLVLENCTVTNGSATVAGNIYIKNDAASVSIQNVTVSAGSAADSYGNIYIASDILDLTNNTVSGGQPEVARVLRSGSYLVAQYNDLQSAINAAQDQPDLSVQLLRDTDQQAEVTGTVYLDLNGFHLSGITITGTLYGMDSTTDGYDGSNAGTLTALAGAPAPHVKTSQTQTGSVKRYLAISENGSYSFHRFYIGVTGQTLKPSTAGMGYKATFAGSEQVKNALSDTAAYGYSMWLTESGKLHRGYASEQFGGVQELTLRIDNFLGEGLTAEENLTRAGLPLYACAYIRLADGTYIESTVISCTFREILEQTNLYYDTYSSSQKTSLQTLSAKFSSAMVSWDIANFHHAAGGVWQEMTSASFNALLKSNSYLIPSGSYVLTENVDIGSRYVKITAGTAVALCLNGYTLTGSNRMFRNYGTLNFCDCHTNGEEGTILGTLTVDPDSGSKHYAPVCYAYYNSVTNLYGGNLTANGSLTSAGVVAVSHDGNSEDTTQVSAVFNMYGGTITGGNTTGSGGNISLWNGSVFNLYGGEISGGSAVGSGGGIIVSGSCTLNIYGGTITGNRVSEGTGGNVSGSGTINMYGGTVSDGCADTADTYVCKGGNIYSTGTLNLLGGTVSGGYAQYGLGGNLYTSGTTVLGDVTVTGGEATVLTVDGEIQPGTGLGGGIYTAKSNIVASGSVNITGNTDSDLYLAQLATLSAQDLDSSAAISVTSEVHGQLSTDPTLLDRFVTPMEDSRITVINDVVALVPADTQESAVTDPDSVFRVGYSMVNITPEEEGLTMSSFGNPQGRYTSGVNYELYVTTIAVTDMENNTFLMITMDLQNTPEDFLEDISTRINQVTGVPAGNIYLSATHTHNVPTITTATAGNTRYRTMVVDRMVQGALEAMADRCEATMETGSFETVGMNFSRHYYYLDEDGNKVYFGDQFGTSPSDKSLIQRVKDGDPTMHMLAFNRTEKDPILLVNWRAHPHRSGGKTKYTVDADVIGALREYMHTNTNYQFAYFQGAAGNMNTTSRISGETYMAGKITEYGNELGRQLVEGLANLKPVETGLIQTTKIIYAAPIDHSEDYRYEEAVALRSIYSTLGPEDDQISIANQYGFSSFFHASRLIAKYNLGETRDLELNIFSIGEHVAFYTAPGELWDSISVEMEEASPFDMTFTLGYSNGNVAYLPYQVTYSSYEYHYCLFTQDETVLQMMEYYKQSLQAQFENAK